MAEETPLSGPPPAEKPHGQEVSNTLQFYLLVFTVVFILILGECVVMLTLVNAFQSKFTSSVNVFQSKFTSKLNYPAIHKCIIMVMLIQRLLWNVTFVCV